MTSRRRLLGIAAWAATAAIATAVGMAAISALGTGITGRTVRPLTARQIDRALAAPQPTTAPPPTAPPTGGITRSLSTTGGTVLARCDPAGNAYLLSWTPAQGYAADNDHRGPDQHVHVEFESETHQQTVTVTCHSGIPVATTTNETDDD